MKLLTPKTDVVFHSLFRKGNERITKAFIGSITKEKIDRIELETNRELILEYPENKMGILDLKAILNNGEICNIEVQLLDKGNIEKRILYYWSRLYSEQLKRGKAYQDLQKTICIVIIDYELRKLKEIEASHTKWRIKEEKERETLVDRRFRDTYNRNTESNKE